MTGSTLAALTANPAPSPETGLISIRFKHPLFGCRMPKYSFLFVSRLFFTQKYLASAFWMPIEPTHGEHHLPLTDEQWAKLEPLIPPPESAAARPSTSASSWTS